MNPYSPPKADEAPEDGAEAFEPIEPKIAPPEAPRPLAAPDEEFVTVYETSDVLEAHALAELLASEGIAAPKASLFTGASVGAASIGAQPIRVPASQAEQARELVEAFLAAAPLEEAADDSAEPVRSRVFARSFVFWIVFALAVIGFCV